MNCTQIMTKTTRGYYLVAAVALMDGKCQARAAARQQQVAVGICGTACCIVLTVRVFQCRHSDSQITPSPRDQTRWCVCMYVFGLTMAPDEQHTSWQFKAQESGNDSAGQARVLLNGSGWAVQDVYLPGSSRKLQAQAVSLKSLQLNNAASDIRRRPSTCTGFASSYCCLCCFGGTRPFPQLILYLSMFQHSWS